MTKRGFTTLGLGLVLAMPLTAQAEQTNYHCTYTQATYSAPFMKEAKTRNCPEGKCSYQVTVSGSNGVINGVMGFSVTDSESQLILDRTAKDPIMGGMDNTRFVLDKTNMTFEIKKTTTPSVVLTTSGSCS